MGAVNRRDLLVGGLAATLLPGVIESEPGLAAVPSYPNNRAPLQPAAFLRLPPGAARAQGWLATQLDRQVNGLCGRYPDTSHFLQYANTGWTNSSLGGWEEVPYWLRGYADLGYVTGNATVLTHGPALDRRRAGHPGRGRLLRPVGPAHLTQRARRRLAAHAHAATDSLARRVHRRHADQSVPEPIPGLRQRPAGRGLPRRLGHLALGRHDRCPCTGSTTAPAKRFLLDLVRKIHANSANWVNNLPTLHNVNVAQGFREPAQYWMLSGDAAHRSAAYNNYNAIQTSYGQFPGGGFAGDENVRPGFTDPRQGFETCGIVEYMLSHELLTRITGDAVWSDRVEELAFNSLPAALDPMGKAIHYITSANCIDLDNAAKTMAQFQNGFAMQSYRPGVDQYRCCPHNYGMGWPYYVEEMWLATTDGGLCAALYGPSTVTARVNGAEFGDHRGNHELPIR